MKPIDRLHPELAAIVARFPAHQLTDELVRRSRDALSRQPPAPSTTVERSDHMVRDEPQLLVRVNRPLGATGPLPCLYWMHGGGYIGASVDLDDSLFEVLSPKLGIVTVSVDYRTAPETPYPGPLEDCYAGLRWVFERADELGVDPDRIGIGGVSAGGGLAAALALLARDRGELTPAFQLLDCPMLDDRQITASSQQDDLPIWTRESNAFGWRSYLGDLYGRDDVPYTAAPARAQDLSGLPPAFVAVGAVDGFLDEDVDYAQRLNGAGVPTELHVYPGLPHGYRMAPECAAVQRVFRDRDDWLRVQLGTRTPTA
jgi:acetyl esterase/lipase